MSVSGYTLNYRLAKQTFQARGWHTRHWLNLDAIDGALASLAEGTGIPFGTVGGTGDAITVDFTPNVAYTNGQQISFVATAANTGATTVNCDALGAKALQQSNGLALSGGFLQDGTYVRAIYDSNEDAFVIIFPQTVSYVSAVSSGDSGATPDPEADDLYVENNGNAGFSILSPDANDGRLYFGRVSSPDAGGFHYDHAQDRLYFRTNELETTYFDGNVLIEPSRTFFRVYRDYAAAALPASGTAIAFNAVQTSKGDGSYVTATGVFTVNRAATLRLRAILEGTGSAAVTHVFAFYINGVEHAVTFSRLLSTTVSGYPVMELAATFAATNTIEVRMKTNGGASNFTGRFLLEIEELS
jgi:hypothetical protein